jgi:soluble lytic murein transglycosylase-like protein
MIDSRTLRVRGGLIVLGAVLVSSIAGWAHRAAADEQVPASASAELTEYRSLSRQLEAARGELAVARLQLGRADAVIAYSTRYLIPADLAGDIYDIALAEGIEPGLALALVKVESRFNARAHSSAGAIGLTQILPNTARLYEPGITTAQLYDRDTNLRLGFRYLHDLLDRYDNDLERALLAYNRGPSRLQEMLDAGVVPPKGYARSVIDGYRRSRTQATE